MGEITAVVRFNPAPKSYVVETDELVDRGITENLDKSSTSRDVAEAYLKYLSGKQGYAYLKKPGVKASPEDTKKYEAYVDWAMKHYCDLNFPRKKQTECMNGDLKMKDATLFFFEAPKNEKFKVPLDANGAELKPPKAEIIGSPAPKPSPIAVVAADKSGFKPIANDVKMPAELRGKNVLVITITPQNIKAEDWNPAKAVDLVKPPAGFVLVKKANGEVFSQPTKDKAGYEVYIAADDKAQNVPCLAFTLSVKIDQVKDKTGPSLGPVSYTIAGLSYSNNNKKVIKDPEPITKEVVCSNKKKTTIISDTTVTRNDKKIPAFSEPKGCCDKKTTIGWNSVKAKCVAKVKTEEWVPTARKSLSEQLEEIK